MENIYFPSMVFSTLKHVMRRFKPIGMAGNFILLTNVLLFSIFSCITASDNIVSIVIEDAYSNQLPASLQLDHPDSIILFSIGYDSLHNRIGPVICNWSANGILHSIDKADSASHIVYRTTGASADEFGNITAVSIDNRLAFDMVHIEMSGPAAALWQAVSLDLNCNGLIDAIEAKFTRPVDLSVVSAAGQGVLIQFQYMDTIIEFEISEFEAADSGITSIIHLRENTNAVSGCMQSGWKPVIRISDNAEIYQDSALECLDGAGPVLSKVVSTSRNDSTPEKVVVFFSEKISGYEGNILHPSSNPLILFDVCEIKGTDTLFSDSLLSGIDSFAESDSSSITFYMENGMVLTESHFMRIKTVPRSPLRDAAGSIINGPGNSACGSNRLVGVTVIDSTAVSEEPAKDSRRGCGDGAAFAFLAPVLSGAGRRMKRRR